MLWSKVANAVLDANGGRNRPYLSTNPDARNINHLWEIRNVPDPAGGEAVMLIPRVRGTQEACKK